MNHKIKLYIEVRRNDIKVDDDSDIIEKTYNMGELHQLKGLEIHNKCGVLDEHSSFIILSVSLNVILIVISLILAGIKP